MLGSLLAAAFTRPRKPLAMTAAYMEQRDFARLMGQAIEEAIQEAKLEKKDAADRMGYQDQSALSRWIAGIENPQLHKLWGLGPVFQKAFVIALARRCPAMRVDVTLTADDARVSA
jgi:transcriptional regulator with XRE-family HTH domain